MDESILGIVVLFLILVIVILMLIHIAIKLRKYGGSLTTLTYGSTYEFLNKDNQKAVKEMLEMKINKKTDEQKSDKPPKDI